MKLAKDKVSFKIRLAAFQVSGGADTRCLKPSLIVQDHFHGGSVDVAAADNDSHTAAGLYAAA